MKKYIAAVMLAMMFHISALMGLLFAAIRLRHGTVRFPLILLIVAGGFGAALAGLHIDTLAGRYSYLGELDSGGATIRIGMNVAAFAALLLFRRRWRREFGPIELWAWMGALSVVALVTVPFAAAFADRLALYFAPIQVVVGARLPLLVRGVFPRTLAVFGVLLAYGMVLGVWLNFAWNAASWIPYQNILLDSLFS